MTHSIKDTSGNIISLEELRECVLKSQTERLGAELKLGQKYSDVSQIDGMTRTDLVNYVTHLRELNGLTTSVKQYLPAFDKRMTDNAAASIM